MKKRKTLISLLMISSQKIYLLIIPEESSIIPNRRKQRIKASIGQRKQLKRCLHKCILIPLNGSDLYKFLPLILYFLQLSNLLLPHKILPHLNLLSKVGAKR